MKFWSLTLATLLLCCPLCVHAQHAPVVTTLQQIHTLTNEMAAQKLPVAFDATVTYNRGYERTLFVQDGLDGIYIQYPGDSKLVAGDRVHIEGTTLPSFHPIIDASKITLLRHNDVVTPVQAHFTDLSHARYDSQLVQVKARILSADISVSSDRPNTRMTLLIDGSPADASMDSSDRSVLPSLIDSEALITAVASANFDGKMAMTGVLLHITSLADVHVLQRSATDPWTLPVTSMDQVFSAFNENSLSERVRVEGVVTYYYPGSSVVLQNGLSSIWINTHSREDLRVGNFIEATGFPDVHDGFLRLDTGAFKDTRRNTPITPVQVKWVDLSQSHYVFNLVSIEAQVVAEVREAARDVYVLRNEGHLFSAIYRHPEQPVFRSLPMPPLKDIPIGATVRVVGICLVEDSNPFNGSVPVDLLMRSSEDISVIARPSPITVANLVKVVAVLLIAVLLAAIWVGLLRRRVRRQSLDLAQRAADEAAQERRNTQIEQRRSRILEDINGSRPLAEILEEITALVSFSLNGAACWCEVADGARLGQPQLPGPLHRIVREEIPARSGPPLGSLSIALPVAEQRSINEEQSLLNAARLATLAIETRRLYIDLVHRSEFDLLTDSHNRFSLDRQLESLIAHARENAGIFGLIFVDLDEFKQVNDVHGHHIGDLYLQEVASRMKHQLRQGDLLARLGGDEFAALVPTARTRSDVEEIASRLQHCFAEPFEVGGITLRGTASIGIALYPEDGSTNDSLLSSADAAMYVAKHSRPDAKPRTESVVR